MLKSTTFINVLVPVKKSGRFYCTGAGAVRVRFAPSPTGYLHLGGLRTALYNFLYAKKHRGKFILRIEDTDRSRKVEGAVAALQEDLEWCGIEISEGPTQGGEFGPYLQSERLDIYRLGLLFVFYYVLKAKMLKSTTFINVLVPVKTSGRFYCTGAGAVRVRFAPSPTGYLHLGGLRTALYNFLYAKKHRGKFILRIEDTDRSRKVEGAVAALQEDLEWCGIEISEGPTQGGEFGPYLQSERLDIYRKHIEVLLESGLGYRCFCTDRRLQLIRKEALKAQEIPKYDNKCRYLSPTEISTKLARNEPHCIRFKISEKEEHFHDLIYGNISYNISVNEGDPVVLKSDGYPTYHFANVVDDHLMEISHVLRGVEWQISTTKHLLLYRAFGWDPPKFGHLPLLMNADGSKLSKRQGDIRIGSYRENHVFPLALLNFIVVSGGGFNRPHLKPQCYTTDQLSEQFDLEKINSHSGKLMGERLWEFNRLELKRQLNDDSLREELIGKTRKMAEEHFGGEFNAELSRDYIEKILIWAQNRVEKLPDLFSANLSFVWTLPKTYDLDPNICPAVQILRRELSQQNQEINGENLNSLLRKISKENGIKHAVFMKSLRIVLSGLKEGPSIGEMVEILGKNHTVKRLDLYLNKHSDK